MRWFNIFISLTGLVTIMGCSGCRNKSIETSVKTITVSILPQKYMVQKIAGDKFKINVLVPQGSGPETYEPTAMQMQSLSKSTLYFTIGLLDFEKGWHNRISELNPDLTIVNTSDGIELLKGHSDKGKNGHSNGEHDGHHHEGIDPHTWLSLKAVKIQSLTIRDHLISIDPANKDFYTNNQYHFSRQLDSIDALIINKLKTVHSPAFMIYHPSLSYFSRDYGIEQIPIELEGKEPSPTYMCELIDIAKQKKINTIFYSQQFDKRSAEIIATQLKITLSGFDPLAENIEKNLLTITNQIFNSTTK